MVVQDVQILDHGDAQGRVSGIDDDGGVTDEGVHDRAPLADTGGLPHGF